MAVRGPTRPSGALSPSSASFSRRAPLDGLRGIMALLVVAFHLRIPHFPQGYSGVDGFFVLSGFVISSILIREQIQSRSHSLDYYRFYARRTKRLLPASLVVLLVTTFAFRAIGSDMLMSKLQGSLLSASCFSENIYLVIKSADYFAFNTDDSPVMHYWSLAVEEQFYFVFPVLFSLLMKWTHFRLTSVPILITLIVALVIYQYSLLYNVPESYLYFGTQFRLYQLLCGVVLGIVFYHYDTPHHSSTALRWTGTVLSVVGLIGLIAISTPIYLCNSFAVGLMSTLCTIVLIVAFEWSPTCFMARVLDSVVMQFLGRHSYAIYLWHYPLIILMRLLGVRTYDDGRFVSDFEVFGVIILLSWLSWVLVEAPVKNVRLSSRKTVLIGMSAVLITAMTIGVTTSVSMDDYSMPAPTSSPSRSPTTSPPPIPGSPSPAPSEPPSPSQSALRGPPTAEGDPLASTPISEPPTPSPSASISISRSPSASASPAAVQDQTDWVDPTYFLIGDSFAEEWMHAVPVIANTLGITFRLWDVPGCPWFPGWRDLSHRCNPPQGWLDLLHEHPAPRVVFCVAFAEHQHEVYIDDRPVTYTDPRWAPFVEQSMRDSLDLLLFQESGNQVIIMHEHFLRPPKLGDCLVRRSPRQCNQNWDVVPLNQSMVAPTAELMDAMYARIKEDYKDCDRLSWISIDQVLAPNGVVNATDENGVMMWRDEFHMSWDWARVHAMELASPMMPWIHKYPRD